MPEQESPIIATVSNLANLAPQRQPTHEGAPRQSKEVRAERLFGLLADYKRIEASMKKRVAADRIVDPKTQKRTGLAGMHDEYSAAQKEFEKARINRGYVWVTDRGQRVLKEELALGKTATPEDEQRFKEAYKSAQEKKLRYERTLMATILKHNPQAAAIARETQTLWGDAETQDTFKRGLREHERQERQSVIGRIEYGQLKRELSQRRALLFENLSRKFQDGRLAPTLLRIEIEELEARVDSLEEGIRSVIQPDGRDRESTDRAAMAKYDDLSEYRRQLERNFIWGRSRLQILRQVMKNVAGGVWTMLKGEAGSGKTQLARTAATLLQGGNPPIEAAGREYSAAKGLVGVQSISDKGGDFWTFGTIMRAVTGFKDSREASRHADLEAVGKSPKIQGRIAFIDEANLYPPGVLEGPLKAVSGRRPGEWFTVDELPGATLRVADEGTGMIVAINPADARYDNRKQFPPSLARLFIRGRIDVDYPKVEIGQIDQKGKQTNNTELHDMFLAALMTRDGRIMLPASQLAPSYREVEDRASGRVTRTIGLDPADINKHGALFNFALLTTAVNESFSHKGVQLPGESSPISGEDGLEYTVLDMGTVMGWVRDLEGHGGVDLQRYFWDRLEEFSGGIEKSSEDLAKFKRMTKAYGFDLDDAAPVPQKIVYRGIMTPVEMGYLSPEVPRPVLRRGEELGPKYVDAYSTKNPDVPPRQVDANPVDLTKHGVALVLEKGTRCRVSDKELYFVGRDAEKGTLIFSADADMLEDELFIPDAALAQMQRLGKFTAFSPIRPSRRSSP